MEYRCLPFCVEVFIWQIKNLLPSLVELLQFLILVECYFVIALIFNSRQTLLTLVEYLFQATLKRRASKLPNTDPTRVLLDDNLMEMTDGRPVPMKLAAKVMHEILNWQSCFRLIDIIISHRISLEKLLQMTHYFLVLLRWSTTRFLLDSTKFPVKLLLASSITCVSTTR